MKCCTRNLLPCSISRILWGDRKRWGLVIQEDDPCWKEWTQTYLDFYEANQRNGVGIFVNNAGYKVMSNVDLSNKTVLEIGAGDIRHINFWQGGKPSEYIIADVQKAMLDKAVLILSDASVPTRCLHVEREMKTVPLKDNSVDIIISFYSLEHIFPLGLYLEDLHRLLRPGGMLIGAIPAEGGLAWGLGRSLTSRRWLKTNTSIDPDKIICWEHPNFGDDILKLLDKFFIRKHISYWPLPFVPLLDVNLVIRFIYEKEI